MAISKTDLLNYISESNATNGRPTAKNTIIAVHGESAVAVLKELLADGTVACRRGRNGGYFPATPAAVTAEDTEQAAADEAAEIAEVADISDQFAALQARLAAAEAAENEANESENAPF